MMENSLKEMIEKTKTTGEPGIVWVDEKKALKANEVLVPVKNKKHIHIKNMMPIQHLHNSIRE